MFELCLQLSKEVLPLNMSNAKHLEAMLYPSVDIAPSVETLFVNGVKFDICEATPSVYNLCPFTLRSGRKKPAQRFFLITEDLFLYGEKNCKNYCKVLGCDTFEGCAFTKKDALALVDDYQKYADRVKALRERAIKQPFMQQKIAEKVRSISQNVIDRYGFELVVSYE